jgi:hypothetical protein
MKITKSYLKEIIKEEVDKLQNEGTKEEILAGLRDNLHNVTMKNKIHLPESAFRLYSNVQIVSIGRLGNSEYYPKAEIYDNRRDGKGGLSVTEVDFVSKKRAGSPLIDKEVIKRCEEVMDAYKAYMEAKLSRN